MCEKIFGLVESICYYDPKEGFEPSFAINIELGNTRKKCEDILESKFNDCYRKKSVPVENKVYVVYSSNKGITIKIEHGGTYTEYSYKIIEIDVSSISSKIDDYSGCILLIINHGNIKSDDYGDFEVRIFDDRKKSYESMFGELSVFLSENYDDYTHYKLMNKDNCTVIDEDTFEYLFMSLQTLK